MENEILQQVLTELKFIRESQAVLEREVGDVKANQQMANISLSKLDRNQAVIQQGQDTTNVRLDRVEESLQTVRNSQMKVELEQYPRIAAALDGYKLNSEKLDIIQKSLDDITTTVLALDIIHQPDYPTN